MASTIGYITDEGMPLRHLAKDVCGVCGESNVGMDELGLPEKQVIFQTFNSENRS